jgi:hypothetical protein
MIKKEPKEKTFDVNKVMNEDFDFYYEKELRKEKWKQKKSKNRSI